MQQEEVEGVDNPDFAPSLLDLPETGDSDGFGSDFGDFGRFGEGTENQGEKAFDSPPTETDIPLSDPLPDLEEDEFIDPTELAEPSASFDDAFGDNLASDNVNDDDLLAIDNTEVLEPDDPFADFGDFFQDDEPIPSQGGKNRRFMAVGIIAAGAVVGLTGYALYFGFPSANTATQTVATATTAPQEETAPQAKTEDEADVAVADEANANEADANVDEINTDEADVNVDEVNTDAADEADADGMNEETQPTVSEPTPPISEPKKPTTVAAKPAAPKPKPAPKTNDLNALVETGWKDVDKSRLKSAAISFEKILSVDPTHAEGNYGMGYALIKQGKRNEARTYLCSAFNKVAEDTSPEAVRTFRDVKGLLKNNQLVCDGT
jgi:hypothetical protein